MEDKEKTAMKGWVDNWKKTGPLLDELRRKEAQNLNISEEILSLSDASEAAIKMYPPKKTSGLIEMQRYFMKFKK